jgi:hypothetical protein
MRSGFADLQIQRGQDGGVAFKREGQAPVAIDADRPVSGQTALERGPVPAVTIHVFGPRGCILRRQLLSQARSVCGLDPKA